MKRLVIASLVVLSGCATYQVSQEKMNQAQGSVPACSTEKQCTLMWAAARKWVLTNSTRTMKIVTDDYIQTEGPTPGSPEISVRVSKEPRPQGGYRFVVGVYCDNMFGCKPDSWDSAIAFNRAVTDAGR